MYTEKEDAEQNAPKPLQTNSEDNFNCQPAHVVIDGGNADVKWQCGTVLDYFHMPWLN